VIVLFLWDTICVWWLFTQPDRRLSFRVVFRLRCDTVVWSAVSLDVGQAAFAWQLATVGGIPLANTLGYCVLLGKVDAGTLLSLAMVGSFVYPDPWTQPLRWVCLGGLACFGLFIVVVQLMPDRWRAWLAAKPWASCLSWLNARTLGTLVLLRLVLFLLVLAYAGVGLAICRVPVDTRTVLGIIPFVLMAEALPGTAGLGERETALVYFYPAGTDQRAVLLAFGLIWSTVVILGRIIISLVSWCVPHADTAGVRQPAASHEGANRAASHDGPRGS
jgi:hypothetical protein